MEVGIDLASEKFAAQRKLESKLNTMNKETFEALERVINQIGGGHPGDFYEDLAKVKEWAAQNEFSTLESK